MVSGTVHEDSEVVVTLSVQCEKKWGVKRLVAPSTLWPVGNLQSKAPDVVGEFLLRDNLDNVRLRGH